MNIGKEVRLTLKDDKKNKKKSKPSNNVKNRQNQLIQLAMSVSEKQLRQGVASSQVITHYLKLGTLQAELEIKKLEHENALLIAKTEALKSSKNSETLFAEALKAMRSYSGVGKSESDAQ